SVRNAEPSAPARSMTRMERLERVFLTNDDGIDAPGLAVLEQVAAELARGVPADLRLPGVNRGANLGIETVFSGTVGAAMTAMLLGLPAIALSQAFSDRSAVPWDTAPAHAPG